MALFTITPKTDITAFLASSAVSSGDVLLLEDGIYRQSVLIEKSYVHLVANGSRVIFDGANVLASAFVLSSVLGVEIQGMKIQDYAASGILISFGIGNRLIANQISSVGGDGIDIRPGDANLLWKNEVCAAQDGISISGVGRGNFFLENRTHHCRWYGISCLRWSSFGNTFLDNISEHNEIAGMVILSWRNLLLGNCVKDNAIIGIELYESDGVSALRNKCEENPEDGIQTTATGCFMSENLLSQNGGRGILVDGSFQVLQENTIEFNQNNGLEFTESSGLNTSLDNTLKCNKPQDLVNSGINNNFIGR